MRNYFNNNKKKFPILPICSTNWVWGWDYMWSWSVSFDGAEITHLWCQSLKKHILSRSLIFSTSDYRVTFCKRAVEAKHFWDRSAFALLAWDWRLSFPPSALIFWMVCQDSAILVSWSATFSHSQLGRSYTTAKQIFTALCSSQLQTHTVWHRLHITMWSH